MVVTGLIRTERISYTQFSLKKELHSKLKRTVQTKRRGRWKKRGNKYSMK
jgi:hypothetical protein